MFVQPKKTVFISMRVIIADNKTDDNTAITDNNDNDDKIMKIIIVSYHITCNHDIISDVYYNVKISCCCNPSTCTANTYVCQTHTTMEKIALNVRSHTLSRQCGLPTSYLRTLHS